MISARRITRIYSDGYSSGLRVLDGLNLEVGAGEFVAIVGPSGSGKSTLLHLLGGLDVQYEGQLEVCGLRLTGLSDRELARFRNRYVGFVFQSFHLIPNLAAIDNVLLPAFFGSRRATERDRARAGEVLVRVGLAGKESRIPAQLSGGERQRVAMARALFREPQLLLCDEPTGNLDVDTGREIIALLSQLHRGGLTVVTVTHENRMSAAAQRVLKLTQGTLVEVPVPGGRP